jgi:peroxiredoxin
LGFQVIAVSPSSQESSVELFSDSELNYTLIADPFANAIRAYGVAFEEMKPGYADMLSEVSGEDHHLLPAPSVFIIAEDGNIGFSYVNPNHRVRIPRDVLLAAAKSIAGK